MSETERDADGVVGKLIQIRNTQTIPDLVRHIRHLRAIRVGFRARIDGNFATTGVKRAARHEIDRARQALPDQRSVWRLVNSG